MTDTRAKDEAKKKPEEKLEAVKAKGKGQPQVKPDEQAPAPMRALVVATDGSRVQLVTNQLSNLEMASVARMILTTAEQLIAKANGDGG